MKFLTGFCLVVFLLLFLFRTSIFKALNIESINDYWYWIPVTIFVTGLFSLLTFLANKKKQFQSIAASNISFNGLSSLLKIAFRYVMQSGMGMIAANAVGQFLACFSFYKQRHTLAAIFKGRWRDEKKAGKKYKAFPIYNMTRSFINSFSGNLPFLLLTGIFGEATLGLFSMAFTMSFRPISLISNSIYQVFFERTSFLKQQQKPLSSDLKEYLKKLILLGIPCFIGIYFLAPWIFKFFFGLPWIESGVYFRMLLPWMFMILAATPLGFIPILLKKQHTALIWEIVYLAARMIALGIGIYFDSFKIALMLFSMVGTCYLVGHLPLVFYVDSKI